MAQIEKLYHSVNFQIKFSESFGNIKVSGNGKCAICGLNGSDVSTREHHKSRQNCKWHRMKVGSGATLQIGHFVSFSNRPAKNNKQNNWKTIKLIGQKDMDGYCGCVRCTMPLSLEHWLEKSLHCIELWKKVWQSVKRNVSQLLHFLADERKLNGTEPIPRLPVK